MDSKVYNQFVTDDKDVVGMLAYSLFRRHEIQSKKQYIENYKADHNGQSPSDSGVKKIVTNIVTPAILNSFRKEASDTLLDTTAELMGQQIHQCEEELSKGYLDAALKNSLTDNDYLKTHKEFFFNCLTDKDYLKTHKDFFLNCLKDNDLLNHYKKTFLQSKWMTIGLNMAAALLLSVSVAVLLFTIHMLNPNSSEAIRKILIALGLIS